MGISLKKPEGVAGRSWPAIVIGIFVAFGGVLFGWAACLDALDVLTTEIDMTLEQSAVFLPWGMSHLHSSGILALITSSYWENEFSTGFRDSDGHLNVTASQSAQIVSILSAGTFFGALGAAPIADWIGRRLSLIVSCGVFTIGVIFQTAATELPLFIAGRFFAGFGVGLVSALSIVPPHIKCLLYSNNISHSPSLPIWNFSKVDQGSHCWMLSTCNYHWHPACCHRQQRDIESPGHRLIPDSNRCPIRIRYHPSWWNAPSTRNASVSYSLRQCRESCQISLYASSTARWTRSHYCGIRRDPG